jgi:hypothetical protein
MANPNLVWASRREPLLAGSPQFTPWEENSEHLVEHDGANPLLVDRYHDSQVPTRPSRHRVAFFLQPVGDGDGDQGWTDWSGAGGFIVGKSMLSHEAGFPRGRFTLAEQRRNVAVPPTASYGDLVGELDGRSAYLENEDLLK